MIFGILILVFLSNLVVCASGYMHGYDDAMDDAIKMIDEIMKDDEERNAE